MPAVVYVRFLADYKRRRHGGDAALHVKGDLYAMKERDAEDAIAAGAGIVTSVAPIGTDADATTPDEARAVFDRLVALREAVVIEEAAEAERVAEVAAKRAESERNAAVRVARSVAEAEAEAAEAAAAEQRAIEDANAARTAAQLAAEKAEGARRAQLDAEAAAEARAAHEKRVADERAAGLALLPKE